MRWHFSSLPNAQSSGFVAPRDPLQVENSMNDERSSLCCISIYSTCIMVITRTCLLYFTVGSLKFDSSPTRTPFCLVKSPQKSKSFTRQLPKASSPLRKQPRLPYQSYEASDSHYFQFYQSSSQQSTPASFTFSQKRQLHYIPLDLLPPHLFGSFYTFLVGVHSQWLGIIRR